MKLAKSSTCKTHHDSGAEYIGDNRSQRSSETYFPLLSIWMCLDVWRQRRPVGTFDS